MADWKTRILILGGVLGALAGLLAAMLYVREIEANGAGEPGKVGSGDALSIGLSSLALMRQVAGLARPPAE